MTKAEPDFHPMNSVQLLQKHTEKLHYCPYKKNELKDLHFFFKKALNVNLFITNPLKGLHITTQKSHLIISTIPPPTTRGRHTPSNIPAKPGQTHL